MKSTISYGHAILSGFEYLLENHEDVFVMGQGLWSPWYVGNSMTDLDKKFGSDRVIDTPVSESACTAAALGAGLAGMRPVVIHPRMDFMLYALDAVVNQASKWSHMFGGQVSTNFTIRAIINRGGEQGAQHSQALHSWFAHIPGLRVVLPATVQDARDLLISSVLSPDPVMYIDDRCLYDQTSLLDVDSQAIDLSSVRPQILVEGSDITIVSSSHTTMLAMEASKILLAKNISCEVVDMRIINPYYPDSVLASVRKTKRLLVLDGGWAPCSISSEILASVLESGLASCLLSAPRRLTLPFAPAPTSSSLERIYYPKLADIIECISAIVL